MIDFLATRSHFADHLRPVWDALDPAFRGRFMERQEPGPRAEFVLTAAYEDTQRARRMGYTRQAYLEHGIAQSYVGLKHGSYAGGRGRIGTELFLVPNDHSAARWRAAYPKARVEVVGSPRLDTLPSLQVSPGTVAVSFHWDCQVVPETRSAFAHYRDAIVEMAGMYDMIGHAHPRARATMEPFYRSLGVEFIPDFAEVCRLASVYVADNSSTLYEFASMGRPVVVLNAPWYRREVTHGLRFWEAAGVGANVGEPDQLWDALDFGLDESRYMPGQPFNQAPDREAALDIVYAYRTGAAQRAASALTDWVASRQAVAA